MDPTDLTTTEGLERLRRSLAMGPPGQPGGLTRDDAIRVVEALI